MGAYFRLGIGPIGVSIPLRGKSRKRATYYTHPGCLIHHKSEAAAKACRFGQ